MLGGLADWWGGLRVGGLVNVWVGELLVWFSHVIVAPSDVLRK